MAAAAATPLEHFYQQLFHTDVKKDHGDGYNCEIVNSLLPKAIPCANALSSKEMLFDELIHFSNHQSYDTLLRTPVATHDSRDIVLSVGNTPHTYTYCMVDVNTDDVDSANRTAAQLHAFLGNTRILKITDTARHSKALVKALNRVGTPMIQAHTREVEMDPADKMNPEGDPELQQYFYVEVPGAANPVGVSYPAYTGEKPTPDLSYFYSSRDIVLHNHGLVPDSHTLRVSMDYTNDRGQRQIVYERANIAHALEKVAEVHSTLLEKELSTQEKKEMVFLSKHHGDIAQVLTKCRTIELTSYATLRGPVEAKATIQSSEYSIAFESIDVNAIIKAFSIGTDIIWFHTPHIDGISNRIIVCRHTRLADPALQRQYLHQTLTQRVQALRQLVTLYNEKVEEKNTILRAYNTQCFNYLSGQYGDISGVSLTQKYKNVLEWGLTYSQACRQLPRLRENEVLRPIPMDEVDECEREIANQSDSMGPLQQRIAAIEARTFLPASYLRGSIYTNDTYTELIPTLLDKELLLTYTQVGEGAQKLVRPTVAHCWSLLNLSVTKDTVGRAASRGRRMAGTEAVGGSPLLTSWAFKVVHRTYESFLAYNERHAQSYIRRLYSILEDDSQRESFLVGLGLLDIRLPIEGNEVAAIAARAEQLRTGAATAASTARRALYNQRRGRYQQQIAAPAPPALGKRKETEPLEDGEIERDEFTEGEEDGQLIKRQKIQKGGKYSRTSKASKASKKQRKSTNRTLKCRRTQRGGTQSDTMSVVYAIYRYFKGMRDILYEKTTLQSYISTLYNTTLITYILDTSQEQTSVNEIELSGNHILIPDFSMYEAILRNTNLSVPVKEYIASTIQPLIEDIYQYDSRTSVLGNTYVEPSRPHVQLSLGVNDNTNASTEFGPDNRGMSESEEEGYELLDKLARERTPAGEPFAFRPVMNEDSQQGYAGGYRKTQKKRAHIKRNARKTSKK